jgi:hypothetical protein
MLDPSPSDDRAPRFLIAAGALATLGLGLLLALAQVALNLGFRFAPTGRLFPLLSLVMLAGPVGLFARTRSAVWLVVATAGAGALALGVFVNFHGGPLLGVLGLVAHLGIDAVAVAWLWRRRDGIVPLGIGAGVVTIGAAAFGIASDVRHLLPGGLLDVPILDDGGAALGVAARALAGAFLWSARARPSLDRPHVGSRRAAGAIGAIALAVALLTTLFSRAAFGFGSYGLFIALLALVAAGFLGLGFGLVQVARDGGEVARTPVSAILVWALPVIVPALGVPLLSSSLAIPVLALPIAVALIAAGFTLGRAGGLAAAAAVVLLAATGLALLDAVAALASSEGRWALGELVRSAALAGLAAGFILAAIAQLSPSPSGRPGHAPVRGVIGPSSSPL